MGLEISGFINTWSPSFYATENRIALRNVRQGGNDILAAIPLGCQAMWAGSVMAEVAQIASGPIHAIAQVFRIAFNPLISFPLSILSCAVKERFYESSVPATLPQQTKYFGRGAEVENPVRGTVSLVVDGQLRHFILADDITWVIEDSVVVEENGEMKRFRYHRLRNGEIHDDKCREIEIRGERVWVRLAWELSGSYLNYVELTVEGTTSYFRLGNEVAEPVQGTVEVRGVGWRSHYFLIGPEIQNEQPNCIRFSIDEKTLHYETGREIDGPTENSRSFVINGTLRHFASAKFVSEPSRGLSGLINEIPKMPFPIPTRLSRFTIQSLEFVNQHMSNIVRVAMIAAGAVLAFFGHVSMALGTLLAVSYEYLDHDLGIIPRQVSLFMEKWMPAISMVGLLIVGSGATQIMAGATLLMMIPAVNLWVHQKTGKAVRVVLLQIKEQVVKWFLRGNAPHHVEQFVKNIETFPLLEECDAPLVERRDLSEREIQGILAADDEAYEINPAHLTKDFEPAIQLPENRNFSELTRLWDGIGARWAEAGSYNRLLKKVGDDKRFILFLKERFPEAKRFFYQENWRLSREDQVREYALLQEAHLNQIDEWIQTLAQEKRVSKQQFMADWVREQLQFFVDKLSGNRPIEGEQRLLRDAIENTARIIPFLTKPEILQVVVEDELVKLAIEGGDYCSLAMRRASGEVLEGFVEPLQNADPEAQVVDPQKAFEDEVRRTLQKGRLHAIQNVYQDVVSGLLANEESQDTGADVHLHEAVTHALKRGNYPMNEEEMGEFTISELLLRETFLLPLEARLMELYRERIPDAMDVLGIDRRNLQRNRVLEYLRAWVGGNNSLDAEAKERLLTGPLLNGRDQIIDADNYRKWNRLMLTILGVLREKQALAVPADQPVLAPVPQLVAVNP